MADEMNSLTRPGSDDDDAGLDRMIGQVLGMGRDDRRRGRLAAGLVATLSRSQSANLGVSIRSDRVGQLARLIEIADEDPPPDPGWRRVRAGGRMLVLMASTLHGGLADPA